MKKLCSVADCERTAIAKGLCSMHWARERLKSAPKCSVVNCKKPSEKRGLCGAHYFRLRKNGDPLAGRTPNGAGLQFMIEASKTTSDDCLIWPYGTNGNGYARIDGVYVHRRVCEMAHGPAPSELHEAAHSCGNGDIGCVNQRHLRWATPKENAADKILHGTENRGENHNWAKLKKSDVVEIRQAANSVSRKTLADRYGVSKHTIGHVLSGRSWRHVQ